MEQVKNDKCLDQVKIGKFIAECRKEKKLTQEELASKFGITSQSVSKWENGVNSPDISVLMSLSDILGVEVHELLAGEKKTFSNGDKLPNKEINETIVESVKFYEKRTKRKYFKITSFVVLFVFIMSVFMIGAIYGINNYNKVNIYSISSVDNVLVSGKLIFNPKSKIFMINKIRYSDPYFGTSKEITAKCVKIEIKSDRKKLLQYGDLGIEEEIKPLDEFLKEINVYVSEEFTDEEFGILKDDIDKLEIVISYKDSKGQINSISNRLFINEEFSNNRMFY